MEQYGALTPGALQLAEPARSSSLKAARTSSSKGLLYTHFALILRLVAKLFEHRAKFRAPIGKCARKNATQAVRKNERGAFGAAHILAF